MTKKFKADFWKCSVTALKDLSFSVEEGKIVGYLGANGAGKTTSLRIIMGFTRVEHGEIIFDSVLGKTRNKILKNIGFLPERPYFYPDLTGQDFLNFMGSLCGMNCSEIKRAISRWAPRFKIDYALNRKIRTYSKGMLQRIGFCSALLHDPKLVILDEPLSGLDPVGRKELKDVILEINKQGKTIFFSSHIVPDVEEICEKVVFIEQGKLLYEGSIDKLMLSNEESKYQVKVLKNQASKDFFQKMDVVESENYYIITVPKESCQVFSKNLLDHKIELESLTPIRPSLEEIFYKVKNQERKIHQ